MNKKNQGLTLVEVVIALLLFSIIVIFTLPVFLSASRLNMQSDTNLSAQAEGQEVMELWVHGAASTIEDDFQNTPADLSLLGFSLCFENTCPRPTSEFSGTHLFYLQRESLDIYVEIGLPDRDKEIVVSVFEKEALMYQAKNWLVYEQENN